METCKSPWKVMSVSFEVARELLPDHASKFSRHDFTLAHLFACLAIREILKLSYRKLEALLADTDWCQRIGMKSVPDHSTLCRAWNLLIRRGPMNAMLERIIERMSARDVPGETLAIDSTLYDTHHRSRHYERRCRQFSSSEKRTADTRRSRSAKRTPKLGVGVDTRSHLILSMKSKIGMGSDSPDFDPLLFDAWKRHRIKRVLADAGYDSEANHRIAREDMRVKSFIKTGAGRPTHKRASGRYRRLMQSQLNGSQKGKPFGQRAQVECVMSMLKRNLGDSLRSRTSDRRKRELLLKAVVHNLMILRRRYRGSQQSRYVPFNHTPLAGPHTRDALAGCPSHGGVRPSVSGPIQELSGAGGRAVVESLPVCGTQSPDGRDRPAGGRVAMVEPMDPRARHAPATGNPVSLADSPAD